MARPRRRGAGGGGGGGGISSGSRRGKVDDDGGSRRNYDPKKSPPPPTPPPTPSRSSARTRARDAFLGMDEVAGYSLLALVTAASYSPSLSGGWVWDDEIFVEHNAHLHSTSGLYDIWFRHDLMRQEVHYWPVVYTTLWLEYMMWGLNPTPYRVTNLALHVFNSCLVHRLCRRIGLGSGPSWLSAFIFSVHPTHVESVAWILERKDVLSGSFYLLSLLSHPSTDASVPGGFVSDSRSLLCAKIALALYGAGMLTKSIVVSLPLVLLALPWMYRGYVRAVEIAYSVPFFVAGLTIALWDMAGTRGKDNVDFDLSLPKRVLIVCRAVCFYAIKLVWPSDLVMIYDRWHLGRDRWMWIASLAVAASAPPILWSARRRSGRGPITALVLFVGTLGPTLGLMDYSYMQYSYVADRYQYLAELAIIALFSGGCAHVIGLFRGASKVRRGAIPAAAILVAVLGRRTWVQSHAYKDDESFFGHVTRMNPNGFHGWYHLGTVYDKRERYDDAADALSHAADVLNDRTDFEPHIRKLIGTKLYNMYGSALLNAGKNEEGIATLEEALTYDPDNVKVMNSLGNALSKVGRHGDASEYFRRAVDVDPTYAVGWNNLGNELYRMGRAEESADALRMAVEVRPTYRRGRMTLAFVLGRDGRHEEAAEQYREVLDMFPGDEEAKKGLDDAVARAEKAGREKEKGKSQTWKVEIG